MIQKDPPYPRAAYGYYVTAVLLFAYTVSFIDRQILSLMVEPVKRDLGLSDTAISLLHGFAFAIFYTAMGLVLGRVADRHNRRNLIIGGISVWSAATAACGFAGGFFSLFLARVGVGIGEASLSPAAYSMLADYFPKHRRGRAMGLYSLGVYLGSGLAFIVGGIVIAATASDADIAVPLLGSFRSWQLAFLIVAVPGLFAALLMLTVREPVRREVAAGGGSDLSHFARRSGFYAPAILGFSVLAILVFGFSSWVPTAFIRTWDWSPRDIGVAYGLILLVFGAGGMVLSGIAADAWAARGRADAHLRLAALAAIAAIPCTFGLALATTPAAALLLIALTSFFQGAPIALAPTVLQSVTPNNLRGQAIALYLLILNLIGMGCGPTLVALATDQLFQDEGAVLASIALVTGGSAVVGSLLLGWTLRPYRRLLGVGGGEEAPIRV